jgi:hypothetical protein
LPSSLEEIERGNRYMIVYKFYLRDAVKGDIFLGALPERRKNPKRITEESIINWGRTYFGKNGKDADIFFTKTVLEESEKRWTNISPP